MKELEKILEEIGELRGQAGSECTSEDHYIKKAWEHCLDRVVDIIRNHMNDGWVPVEDRLPDNSEDVLVTTDVGLITFGCLLNGEWITNQEPDYPIAWRTLPEPYKPKQQETCKYTGGSCCWPIDQCAECQNHGCKWLQDCVCCNAYCDTVADFVSTEYCEKCKFYEEEK